MEISELSYKLSAEGCEIPAAPYFCVSDSDAKPLLCADSGEVLIAEKTLEGHTSVYSAAGNLSGDILRSVARAAGVHIYSDTHPVYVNSGTVGVYAEGETLLHVRRDGLYEDLFTGNLHRAKDGLLLLPAEEYSSRLLEYRGD